MGRVEHGIAAQSSSLPVMQFVALVLLAFKNLGVFGIAAGTKRSAGLAAPFGEPGLLIVKDRGLPRAQEFRVHPIALTFVKLLPFVLKFGAHLAICFVINLFVSGFTFRKERFALLSLVTFEQFPFFSDPIATVSFHVAGSFGDTFLLGAVVFALVMPQLLPRLAGRRGCTLTARHQALLAKYLAMLTFVSKAEFLGPQSLVRILQRPPVFRANAVKHDMDMAMRLVPMSDKDRLPVVPTHMLEIGAGRFQHVFFGRFLALVPPYGNVFYRTLQLGAAGRDAGGTF